MINKNKKRLNKNTNMSSINQLKSKNTFKRYYFKCTPFLFEKYANQSSFNSSTQILIPVLINKTLVQ